ARANRGATSTTHLTMRTSGCCSTSGYSTSRTETATMTDTQYGRLIQPAPLAARRELSVLGQSSPTAAIERERLEQRARALAWSSNAWHLVEFCVAVGAGVAAGSVALIGFGFDS